MALRNLSLFLYGFQITENNQFISFGTDPSETGSNARLATLTPGYYSLTTLGTEIVRALTAADPLFLFTFSVNRNVSGGLENRVTISTNATYFSIYFGTGNTSNPSTLLGFNASDLTGSTSYTSVRTSGTVLVPNQIGYNYLPTTNLKKAMGQVNQAASGRKEAIIFTVLQFWQVQFKYIPESSLSAWESLINWMVEQREIEFTPDISSPNSVYSGKLEDPAQGLELSLTEMLPNFPFEYQTPVMKFRLSVS